MTDAELDALEAAAKAATPGPWNVNKEEYAVFINHKKGTIAEIVSYEDCFDAAYIAAAHPAAILELIAELRQTKRKIALMEKELDSSPITSRIRNY